MGLWVFNLVMSMLIPLVMIIGGRLFVVRPPKRINPVYGYRTAISMKNQDTWNFAHRHCGRIWCRVGGAMLPLSVAAMFVFREAGIAVIVIQTLVLILSIFPTEAALKKTFDGDGNRRQ